MDDLKKRYSEKLAEPHLVDAAVPVLIGPAEIDLAVPVGVFRRGGYLEIDGAREYAENALKVLQIYPGFPNPRIDVCLDDDGTPCADYFVVQWGDPPPFGGCDYTEPICAVMLGLHYGYKHEALVDIFERYDRRGRRLYTREEISQLIVSAVQPPAGRS